MVTNPSVCPFGGSGAVCSISVHVLFEYCHTHYLSLESEKRKKERTLLTAAGDQETGSVDVLRTRRHRFFMAGLKHSVICQDQNSSIELYFSWP